MCECNPPAKGTARTITGRKVFGGDGITPDETVKNQTLNQTEIALLDPLFFFSRELISGRIKGFENYKINGQIQYGSRIRPSDFPITDELLTTFKNFALGSSSTANAWNYRIVTRIRFESILL